MVELSLDVNDTRLLYLQLSFLEMSFKNNVVVEC